MSWLNYLEKEKWEISAKKWNCLTYKKAIIQPFGAVVEQTNVPAQRLKQEAAIWSRTVRNLNVKQQRMDFLNCIFIILQKEKEKKKVVAIG